MEQQPLVSVITPSFQAARFIERTIQSVLGQDYPKVEYLVMDAGSTDGTLAILERYRGRLSWFSRPDGGAAAAINDGFARTTGSIVAWLNADDAYEPGAISAAIAGLAQAPDAAAVYGEGLWIDERDEPLAPYPTAMPFDEAGFARECFLCQPAVFMRRAALQASGGLDASLHYAFDYDLWIRLSRVGPFAAIPVRLARSRMHRENKTLGSRKQVFQENIRVLRRHYGYVPVNWVYGYLSFLRDGRDQFFEPLRHSALVYLASLPAGTCYNLRKFGRYWGEWFSRLGTAVPQRAWRGHSWK
jgi:glycosyltransferase involved in cell wall biosynthesis